MNHRSANRRAAQEQRRPSGQPDGIGFSRTQSEFSPASRTFAQDFNMEHSVSAVTVTRVRISAGSDQADTAKAPSCVYLG